MKARSRRLRSAGATALVVGAVAGCGGQSAADTRAELRRWAPAVDSVCRSTRERIVARGGAHDARDLEDLAARAGEDVRAAITRIRRVPISDAARAKVRPFLDELGNVEPRLSDMTRTIAGGELKEIGDLGLRLADQTKLVQDSADAAGLRECADARQFDAVLDAFTAPVYATQIARFEVWFGRELQGLTTYVPPTSTAFVRYLRRAESVFHRAENRLDDLYEHRPNRAVDADTNLSDSLADYEQFLELYIHTLRGGKLVLTPAGVRRFRREVARHEREVGRALAELRKAIGAEPLPSPGAEPPGESDSSPA